MTDNSSKHIYSLTVLRFIAAYMVLGYHFFSFPNDYALLNRFFAQGFLGVDFFFLLSGFVLAYSYYNSVNDNQNSFSRRNFFINRFARIAPIYYLALFLSLPIFIQSAKLIPLGEKALLWSTVPLTLTFTQSFTGLFISQGSWNVPSWSLSVEVFFYCIFPFISINILRSKKVAYYLFTFLILNILFYYLLNILPDYVTVSGTDFKTSWRTHPIYHLPQFLIGNCLAVYFKKMPQINYRYFVCFLIISFFSLLILFSLPEKEQLIPAGHPMVVITFALIIFSAASLDKYIYKYIPQTLLLLGEASYSLYILQVPVKFAFQQTWSKIFKIEYVTGFSYAIGLTLISITTSLICYKLIEIPARKKIIEIIGK